MKDQFKNFIRSISPLKAEILEELANCFRPIQLKKRAHFIDEGEYAKQIGFLSKGVVRAYFVDSSGKEYNKQFFVAPTIIGAYTSLLTKKANRIAQQALTDCEVLVANYSDMEALYDSYHEFERFGRRIAEFYFLEKEQKELEMALLDATQRYQILRERFPQIETQISQRHIASYLGITQTQLSRIRRNLTQH